MSLTRDEIQDTHQITESATQGVFEAVTDRDGDVWVGRSHGSNEEYVLVGRNAENGELFDVLDDAGLLPDEYQPDDPSPSPEDVAEQWYAIRIYHRDEPTRFAPINENTTVEQSEYERLNTLRVNSDEFWNYDSAHSVAAGVTTVPASEVPTDE